VGAGVEREATDVAERRTVGGYIQPKHNPTEEGKHRSRRNVLGPVLLMALRRLASICRSEVMGWRAPRYFLIKRFFRPWLQDPACRNPAVSFRPRSGGRSLGPPETWSLPKAPLPL
jgi:hypothetical protein